MSTSAISTSAASGPSGNEYEEMSHTEPDNPPFRPNKHTRSWASKLVRVDTKRRKAREVEPVDEDAVLSELRTIFEDKEKEEIQRDKSLAQVPRFYFKRDIGSEAYHRFFKESRARFLEKKAARLLDEHELQQLWALISTRKIAPTIISERIDYAAFCQLKELVPKNARVFFTPTVFLKFPRDALQRISARAFFHYIVRTVSVTQLRISLTCYDEIGAGYLREQDLENYIFEQIPSLPQLHGLEPDFFPYYVFTAVRKFVFFLDPLRKGKIFVKDIVDSPILREFNELRQKDPMEEGDDNDWFTATAALKVYATYLGLDVDHNGMLSKEEFSRFSGGTLTPVFVDRLFQEYRMYRSETGRMEMDYKTFLDFVLAMQNKGTPQSLAYFWNILDIEHKGYLTLHTLNIFFKSVVDKLVKLGHESVRVEDVTSEIFDMVRPEHPYRITLQDLIRSRVGQTVVSILTDVNGFWQYDNREMLVAHEE